MTRRGIGGAILLCLAAALPAAGAEPQTAVAPAKAAASTMAVAPRGAIPFKQEKQGGESLPYQSLAGVVLAGLAAYGIVAAIKHLRANPGLPLRKTRRVQTLEATRLGRKSMLYVVDYHGQELLLAEGEHGIELLSTRAAPPPGDEGAGHA